MAPTWFSRSEGIETPPRFSRRRHPFPMTETKAELRTRMRSERKRLKAAVPDAGERLAERLDELLAALGREPAVAALYLPMGSEMDPLPLAHALAARGVRLAMPRADLIDSPLDFHVWRPGDPIEADASGSAAPLHSTERLDPDLVLMPLIAFDRAGGRLGQGGGYYDRTLEQLAERDPRPAFVGLAFAGQEARQVPADLHDQKLDGVLTENGYIPARKG